jgi:hypothetical protein
VSNDDTAEVMESGRSDVAMDAAAKKGDWEKVWNIATKQRLSAAVVGKYVLVRIEEVSSS